MRDIDSGIGLRRLHVDSKAEAFERRDSAGKLTYQADIVYQEMVERLVDRHVQPTLGKIFLGILNRHGVTESEYQILKKHDTEYQAGQEQLYESAPEEDLAAELAHQRLEPIDKEWSLMLEAASALQPETAEMLKVYANFIVENDFESKIDQLTNLINDPAVIKERLYSSLREIGSENESNQVNVIARLDIDGMHELNTKLGYEAVNQLMQQMATALLLSFRDDFIARAHKKGDEFIMQFSCPLLAVDAILKRVQTVTQTATDGQVRLSIGAVVISSEQAKEFLKLDREEALKSILEQTDKTIMVIKDTGRGRHEVYSPDIEDKIKKIRQLK